jgi:predicted enzyme related to lactoylglutathione lyase
MPTRLDGVVIDTADPTALARWWSRTLGWPVTSEGAEEAVVEPSPDSGARGLSLVFCFADDPKPVKNRLHLDLRSDSLEHQKEQVQQLIDSGAAHRDIGQGDLPWVVLTDPHGNEFCVLEPRDVYTAEAGPVAALVVDALDPRGLAGFWAEAIGWHLEDDDQDEGETVATLRHPDGRGPFLEFVPTREPHKVKNRLHLDIAPEQGEDQAAAVQRLIDLGATPVEIGQSQAPPGEVTWVVLADPEGNEFCVLTPR